MVNFGHKPNSQEISIRAVVLKKLWLKAPHPSIHLHKSVNQNCSGYNREAPLSLTCRTRRSSRIAKGGKLFTRPHSQVGSSMQGLRNRWEPGRFGPCLKFLNPNEPVGLTGLPVGFFRTVGTGILSVLGTLVLCVACTTTFWGTVLHISSSSSSLTRRASLGVTLGELNSIYSSESMTIVS
jgi:hypothetical protein